CAFAAREARGCNGTRHSLRPLIVEGDADAKLGQNMPRERGGVSLSVIASQRVRANAQPDDRLREVRRVGKAKRAHQSRVILRMDGGHGASAPFAHPTGGVIASGAKQSTLPPWKHLDCFVAEPVIGPRVRADPLAPRN